MNAHEGIRPEAPPKALRAAPPASRLAGLLDFRGWVYPTVNRHFTFLAFALPPIAGSVVSFLYNGGAVWCVMEVLRGRYRISRESTFLATTAALYAYALLMIFAALINPNLGQSAFKLVGLISMFLFPFSYTIWRVSDKDQVMQACLDACAVASIGGLLVAVSQVHLMDMNRAEGGAANALVFSNVIALAGGVSLIGAYRAVGMRRLFYFIGFAASALAVVYSASRGPLAVVLANAVLVSAIHARGRTVRAMIGAGLVVIAVITLVVASGISPLADRMAMIFDNLNDITEHGNFSTSVGIRVALWQIGIDLWLQNPIFGYGAGNLETLIAAELSQHYGITRGFSHFHNVFLNTMVEGGLAALLALLAMIFIPINAALHVLTQPARAPERFGATMLLLVFTMFLITGMTNLVLRHDIMDTVFLIFLVVGLYLATGRSAGGGAEHAGGPFRPVG